MYIMIFLERNSITNVNGIHLPLFIICCQLLTYLSLKNMEILHLAVRVVRPVRINHWLNTLIALFLLVLWLRREMLFPRLRLE